MITELQFKASSKEHLMALMSYIHLRYPDRVILAKGCTSVRDYVATSAFDYGARPCIYVDRLNEDKARIGTCCSVECFSAETETKFLSQLDEILSKPFVQPIKLRVGSYDALVQPDGVVKVGCQTIPWGQVRAVVAAIDSFDASTVRPLPEGFAPLPEGFAPLPEGWVYYGQGPLKVRAHGAQCTDVSCYDSTARRWDASGWCGTAPYSHYALRKGSKINRLNEVAELARM